MIVKAIEAECRAGMVATELALIASCKNRSLLIDQAHVATSDSAAPTNLAALNLQSYFSRLSSIQQQSSARTG